MTAEHKPHSTHEAFDAVAQALTVGEAAYLKSGLAQDFAVFNKAHATLAGLEEQFDALLDWLDKPHRTDLWDALAEHLPDHFVEAGNPLEAMRCQAEEIITLRDASVAKRTVWLAQWGRAGSFNELGAAVSNPAMTPES